MKDICVWLVVLSGTVFGICYIDRVRQGKAVATISTWIIFTVGCGLSFGTYVCAHGWDVKSGVLNTFDFGYVSLVLAGLLIFSKQKVKLEPFEKWYLIAAEYVLAYGLITGDAWNSNVLAQTLIATAYIPMYHKLFVQKKKSDSYLPWLDGIVGSILGFYPAIHEGNALSVGYAVRGFIMSAFAALLMLYYQVKATKATRRQALV